MIKVTLPPPSPPWGPLWEPGPRAAVHPGSASCGTLPPAVPAAPQWRSSCDVASAFDQLRAQGLRRLGKRDRRDCRTLLLLKRDKNCYRHKGFMEILSSYRRLFTPCSHPSPNMTTEKSGIHCLCTRCLHGCLHRMFRQLLAWDKN